MSTNPFAAAASKASKPATKGGKKKNDNIVQVEDQEVADAIDEFVEANSRKKQAEADQEVAKSVAVPYCRSEFLKQFAEQGRKPDNSPKFRTPEGNTVTFVTQDRGERYNVSDEQMETLQALLGEEKIEQIIIRDMTFKFNNDILNKDGVMDALGAKIGELVADGVITENEAGALLQADPRTTVRKGALDDLARLCDNDPDQMESVMAALGSHVSNYIKA